MLSQEVVVIEKGVVCMNIKKMIQVGFIIFLLSLNCVFQSMASDFSSKPITKSSAVPWEQAKAEIEAKLADEGSFSYYTKEVAIKDAQYLRYVCITHGIDYSIYSGYEDTFIKLAKEKANIKVPKYSENEYNSAKNAYKGIMNDNIQDKETVIASTNFKPHLDVLPFKNLSFADSQKGGVCTGIAQYEIWHYADRKKLEKLNFTKLNIMSGTDASFSADKKVLDTKINAKGDKILSLNSLILYEPVDINLRGEVPSNLRQGWKSQDNIGNGMVTVATLQDAEEKRLINSIIWLWYWSNRSNNTQENLLNRTGEISNKLDVVPANMLDIIAKQFNANKPILVTLGLVNENSGHAILGYKLTQDKKDPNMYYLHVADNNYVSNYIDGSTYDFKISLYRSTYKGKDALYAYYNPENAAYGDSYVVLNAHPRFFNSDGRMLNTSTSTLKWGFYTTGDALIAEALNAIMFD